MALAICNRDIVALLVIALLSASCASKAKPGPTKEEVRQERLREFNLKQLHDQFVAISTNDIDSPALGIFGKALLVEVDEDQLSIASELSSLLNSPRVTMNVDSAQTIIFIHRDYELMGFYEHSIKPGKKEIVKVLLTKRWREHAYSNYELTGGEPPLEIKENSRVPAYGDVYGRRISNTEIATLLKRIFSQTPKGR